VLVTGRAGAGKSALARLAARDMRSGGATVVAFSLAERSWRTLADVEAELHARLETALAAAATTGGRLLLIDGAEQMLTDGGALLRSLLRVVPRAPDTPPWRLVVTARDEAADAVATVMSEDGPGSGPHRVGVGGIRLWMQRLLADAATGQAGADLPATWEALSAVAAGLAASDGPRWLDIPFEALLNVGPVDEALQQLAGVLAANSGSGLMRLIDVTQRHARPQDSQGNDPGPELDVVLSASVVRLLTGLAGQLPAEVRAAATRLVCVHLRSLPAPPDVNADERLPHAADLPAALIAWAQDGRLNRQERDTAEALTMLAAYLGANGEQFLLAYADEEPDSIGRALEESLAVAALARFRPQLLLRLASLYFLHRDPDAGPASDRVPALRSWAAGRVKARIPVREVADDVLQAGASLAFPAVAVAVLVHEIDAVTDELDAFLASPLVWQLENARAAGEHTGPAIRDEYSSQFGWTTSNAAMHLVLQSGEERRAALRQVGEELADRFEEIVGAETRPLAGLVPELPENDPREVARLQATRWATELDIDHYRAEPAGDGRVKVTVEYPGEVTEKLTGTRGRRARAMVEMSGLLYRAMRSRDGHDAHDPAELHGELTWLQEELDAAGRPPGDRTEADTVAAVAAVLLLGPSRGADVTDTALAWAVRELLDVARRQAEAPPSWLDTPDRRFEQGADRSAASAVPVLLADATLCKRAGHGIEIMRVHGRGQPVNHFGHQALPAGSQPMAATCLAMDSAVAQHSSA